MSTSDAVQITLKQTDLTPCHVQWVEGAKETITQAEKVERKRKVDTAIDKAADKASKLAKDDRVRHSKASIC